MRKLLTLLATAMMLASPSAAQNSPVVVELYTSQGCSSCPPADAFLHELADREDVIALAMHVDYWDYIGWKDSFASADHSKRQRAYAREAGRRMVYTPQMIINGNQHVVGNRPRDVIEIINTHKTQSLPVELKVSRQGDRLQIAAQPETAKRQQMMVQLIRYRPKSEVAIKRGENAGRTLSYANVVTQLTVIGEWDMRAPLSLEADVKGDEPIVVLMQGKSFGPVAAVAVLK